MAMIMGTVKFAGMYLAFYSLTYVWAVLLFVGLAYKPLWIWTDSVMTKFERKAWCYQWDPFLDRLPTTVGTSDESGPQDTMTSAI